MAQDMLTDLQTPDEALRPKTVGFIASLRRRGGDFTYPQYLALCKVWARHMRR